jgi:xylulokinase
VAGVDSSTQSSTVVLRRLADGKIVGEARAPHPPTTPPRSEQDPASWWNALMEALKQLQPRLDQVAAISVGGQGHNLPRNRILIFHAKRFVSATGLLCMTISERTDRNS